MPHPGQNAQALDVDTANLPVPHERMGLALGSFKKNGPPHSFTLPIHPCTLKGSRVDIPKFGWVRMHEGLRFVDKVAGTIGGDPVVRRDRHRA